MRSVLFGNGIIIHHSGKDYLNASIIQRALDLIHSDKFPAHLYPKECADFIIALQKEHSAVLNGKYDNQVFTSHDRMSLQDFKNRYDKNRKYSVTEIGFEDYFLLFELVHNEYGIANFERFNNRKVLRRLFLDAIFNNGKIEAVHEHFKDSFVEWVKLHNYIFTTNYDSNLDIATGLNVYHLHGSFNTLSEIYDPNSFRNKLKDDLLDGEKIDQNYLHLYSNCLVSYVGDIKLYSMMQASLANRGIEKFVTGYKNDPELQRKIDEWDESNYIVRRLKEAIKLKVRQPNLEHKEQYPQEMLKDISGTLEIVGLSPNNDRHLFTQILENSQITNIIFHYFEAHEATDAKRLFASKSLSVRNVRELWDNLNY